MAKTETIKVVAIVENDSITGVKYGTVEVPMTVIDTNKIAQANHAFAKAQNIRKNKLCNRTKNK